MATYTLKTTLLKSNPHVIREFTIDDSASVELLFQVIGVIHGWKAEESCFRLMYDINDSESATAAHKGTIISSSTVLKNIDFDRSLKLSMPFQNIPNGYENFKQKYSKSLTEYADEDCFVFRLEKTGVEEGKSVPQLIRFSGFHPYIKETSMNGCNFDMSKLLSDNGFYDGWKYVRGETFRVSKENINGQLKRVTNKGIKGYKYVSTAYALPLRSILDTHNASELKILCEAYGLENSKSLKKSILVEKLTEIYDNPENWEQILKMMSYTEYLDFKEMCFDKQNIRYSPDIDILKAFCLTDNYYSIPSEFLDYYEQRFNDKGDEDLLSIGKVNGAITVCGRLYLIYEKDVCKKVYRTMFPEVKDLKLFDKLYDQTLRFEKEGGQVLKDNVSGIEYICDVDFKYYGKEKFQSLLADPVFRVLPYKIPSQSEAMDILKHGVFIGEKAYSKIETLLDNSFYWDELQMKVIPKIYDDIRWGKTGAEICNEIRSDYKIRRQIRTDRLQQAINDARKDIPLIPLKGNKLSDSRQHFRICGKLY